MSSNAASSYSRENPAAQWKVSGSFMVTFVRQQALESFMTGVVDPPAALRRDLIENRLDFMREGELPWVD